MTFLPALAPAWWAEPTQRWSGSMGWQTWVPRQARLPNVMARLLWAAAGHQGWGAWRPRTLILSQSPVQCQSCPPSGCDITQRDVVTCDRSWGWGRDSVSWERLQVPFPGLSLWRAWAAHEGRMGVESSRVPWSLELPLPAPRQAGLFCVKGRNLCREWLMGRPFAGAADTHDFLLNQCLSPATAFWSALRARAWAFVGSLPGFWYFTV